ncbi:MAG TPA: hypothetical protein VFZ65_16790 [Planctomycetota bacterium]|nr:hypothetical protein [Planctomycetota bacterium]
MNHICAALSAAALLAAATHAQCWTSTGTPVTLNPTGTFSADDEGRSAVMPLGFTFPMAGSLLTLDHCQIESNGEIYLTDAAGVVLPATYGISSLGELRGGAGGSARVVSYGGDLWAGAGGTWSVKADTSVPGQFKVTWQDVAPYANTTASFSFSTTLFSSGMIQFDYHTGFGTANTTNFVGVSIGNNVGNGTEVASDLSAGPDSGSLGLVYQNTWPPFDLEGSSLMLVPNGSGGYTVATICSVPPATNTSVGTGCYGPEARQAPYQYWSTAAASQVLAGQSLQFTPAGTGYLETWGGGTFVAPTAAATVLAMTDDNEVDVTPSIPFPYLTGPVPTISVCSNGFVNMAPVGNNSVYAYGSVTAMLGAVVPSFRANADYNPASTAATGAVKSQEIGGVLFLTWDSVVRYSQSTPETMQFQLNLNTGVVTIVWNVMGSAGSGLVVGYAPAGPSVDGGSIDFATATPILTAPDVLLTAMALSANPPPISTAASGTAVTYTTANIPEYAPGSGIHIALGAFSMAPGSGLALPLIGIDSPGCFLHVGSLDVLASMVGASSTQTVTFPIPAGVPLGTTVYSQSIGLVVPNSLANSRPGSGFLTSNGIVTVISNY